MRENQSFELKYLAYLPFLFSQTMYSLSLNSVLIDPAARAMLRFFGDELKATAYALAPETMSNLVNANLVNANEYLVHPEAVLYAKAMQTREQRLAISIFCYGAFFGAASFYLLNQALDKLPLAFRN